MKKTQIVSDLKRYAALTFLTDTIGKGAKDVIVCTAKNNSSITVQNDHVKIMSIINQCIVVYYCPVVIIQVDNNDDEKSNNNIKQSSIKQSSAQEIIILQIYNKSLSNKELAVSFPFVIKIAKSIRFNRV